jgi:hypothetical protein
VVVIEEVRWKQCALLAAYAAFAAAALAFALDDGAWVVERVLFALIAVTAVAATGGLVHRMVVARDRPFLVIEEQGFTYGGLGAFGFVPWKEVVELGTSDWGVGERIVRGRVRDGTKLQAARSLPMRFSYWFNGRGAVFWLSDLTLPLSGKELLDLMRARWAVVT